MTEKRECLGCGIDISYYHKHALRCGSYRYKKGCAFYDRKHWKCTGRKRPNTYQDKNCIDCGVLLNKTHGCRKRCGNIQEKTGCNYKHFVEYSKNYRLNY